MTRTLPCLFFSLTAIPVAVFAQASASAPARMSETTQANPISTSTSKMYVMLSGTVVAAAEKMPEENYSFKPVPDVRTFGQLVGHLADAQNFFCATAAGDKPSGGVEKSKTAKADLVAALKDAVAYCTRTYAAMTDAKGSETVKFMNIDFARLAVLSANVAHDYEHYGNMATYMRIKGIVPPSSEKSNGSAEK